VPNDHSLSYSSKSVVFPAPGAPVITIRDMRRCLRRCLRRLTNSRPISISRPALRRSPGRPGAAKEEIAR
jgi:hypothetical protein